MNEVYKKLLDEIILKTERDEILWQKTSRNYQFKMNLPNGMIVFSNESLMPEIDSIYRLDLYDSKGNLLDSSTQNVNQNYYAQFIKLGNEIKAQKDRNLYNSINQLLNDLGAL